MTSTAHGMSGMDYLIKQCLDGDALLSKHDFHAPLPQVFGYLLGKPNPITGNLSKKHIRDAYIALVNSMEVDQIDNGPADAGMTFFGQFVDHDITLEATSVIGTKIDPRNIRNMRTPNLDLDCVYGNGPEASPHMYHDKHKGYLLFGRKDYDLDLARTSQGRALIGDPRNDENIIISQLQGAFICLHNILMTHVNDGGTAADDVQDMGAMSIRQSVFGEDGPPMLKDFEHVRRFVRLHYQWLVLHALLPSFVDQDCIDHALDNPYVFGYHAPIMPAEFSGAAYRFGHATVQPAYTLRDDVSRDLFQMRGFQPRDKEALIEMKHFFSTDDHEAQRALPVGTSMAQTLFNLPPNIVGGGEKWGDLDIPVEEARKLGLRNILRDRTALQLSSGQQIARWLHRNAPQLGVKELPAPKILKDAHIDKTPLWFYCLQEAEEGSGRLRGVGGTIVASVIVRLLYDDPESVLNTDFSPWVGFGGSKMTMGRLMAWVEKNRSGIAHAEDLKTG